MSRHPEPSSPAARESTRRAPAPDLERWEIDLSRSKLTFGLRHLIVSEIRGQFRRWGGTLFLDRRQPLLSSLKVWFDVATIDTDSAERDEHLRSSEFLDVTRFPRAEFESGSVEQLDGHIVVRGRLTLHGVTRDCDVEIEPFLPPPRQTNDVYRARTKLDRQSYGLHWNQDLDVGGVVVADEITVSAELAPRAQGRRARGHEGPLLSGSQAARRGVLAQPGSSADVPTSPRASHSRKRRAKWTKSAEVTMPTSLPPSTTGRQPSLPHLEQGRRLRGRRVGRHRHDVPLHQHLDGDVARDLGEALALRVTVAHPGRQHLAVRDKPHEVLVAIDDGQVTNAPPLELLLRVGQRVADAEGFDDRGHELGDRGDGHWRSGARVHRTSTKRSTTPKDVARSEPRWTLAHEHLTGNSSIELEGDSTLHKYSARTERIRRRRRHPRSRRTPHGRSRGRSPRRSRSRASRSRSPSNLSQLGRRRARSPDVEGLEGRAIPLHPLRCGFVSSHRAARRRSLVRPRDARAARDRRAPSAPWTSTPRGFERRTASGSSAARSSS